MDKAKEYAKALSVFVVALSGMCATLAASPEIRDVFPAAWVAALTAFGAAGALAGVVAGMPNRSQPQQIEKAVTDLGVDVVKQAIDKVTQGLPVADHVTAATDVAGDVVSQILDRVRAQR